MPTRCVVNTCGFVEAAKKDSVDALLEAADLKATGRPQAVVAVGCMAERYGKDLAESLPEADAVLGFDDYPDIAAKLRSIVAGEKHHPHTPQDRRRLLPISPVDRAAASARRRVGRRKAAAGSTPARCRRSSWPAAATGAARSARSRRSAARSSAAGPSDVLAEARWLGAEGARELFLVSENSTSYGKDLGDLRLLETLLPELVAVDGVERVRVSYLQPAETRPGLIEAIATDPRRHAVLRPLLPARQPHGAPPDAPLRRPRQLPRTARAGRGLCARLPASGPT